MTAAVFAQAAAKAPPLPPSEAAGTATETAANANSPQPPEHRPGRVRVSESRPASLSRAHGQPPVPPTATRAGRVHLYLPKEYPQCRAAP